VAVGHSDPAWPVAVAVGVAALVNCRRMQHTLSAHPWTACAVVGIPPRLGPPRVVLRHPSSGESDPADGEHGGPALSPGQPRPRRGAVVVRRSAYRRRPRATRRRPVGVGSPHPYRASPPRRRRGGRTAGADGPGPAPCSRRCLPVTRPVTQALIPLVRGIPPIRSRRGRRRRRPGKLHGDKGYDYQHLRRWLSSRGIRHRIARKNSR